MEMRQPSNINWIFPCGGTKAQKLEETKKRQSNVTVSCSREFHCFANKRLSGPPWQLLFQLNFRDILNDFIFHPALSRLTPYDIWWTILELQVSRRWRKVLALIESENFSSISPWFGLEKLVTHSLCTCIFATIYHFCSAAETLAQKEEEEEVPIKALLNEKYGNVGSETIEMNLPGVLLSVWVCCNVVSAWEERTSRSYCFICIQLLCLSLHHERCTARQTVSSATLMMQENWISFFFFFSFFSSPLVALMCFMAQFSFIFSIS